MLRHSRGETLFLMKRGVRELRERFQRQLGICRCVNRADNLSASMKGLTAILHTNQPHELSR